MALDDEPMNEPMPDAPDGNGSSTAEAVAANLEATEQPQRELEESLAQEQRPAGDVKGNEDQAQDGKVDSEAETEILSGKEDGSSRKSRKSIKLEEAADSHLDVEGPKDKAEEQTSPLVRPGARVSSLKRKRGSEQPDSSDGKDERESSKLSSTVSSPVVERRTSDEIDSKSDQSESSPPIEDDSRQRTTASTKRHPEHDKDRQPRQENIKSSLNGRKRRETRSGTDFDESTQRSASPPNGKSYRAQSSQSNTSLPSGVKKRRKAPAPLHVDRRSRPSEDVHDSDSSSIGDHRSTKVRSGTGENSAMWKASKVSKTNKDRSGRTRLARACASGVVEDVEKWLQERSEDIDVADFAGNTPLQVASLEGYEEIVKLLLEAGCSVDSKNVDGDTPLIDAVENGHVEVVRMLLDAGVDPTQRSQSGKEPVELVNAEMDDADEIRAALLASKKEKDGRRRQSEDQSRSKMSAPRELEIASMANSGPSPTNSTRSPPLESGPKRRTARSQHTDDNLLWVNPTPQRLRDAAGKGDIKIVNHILGMTPKADTDAILAAAQGGHDEVLGLMLAIGNPEADPAPLRSGTLKSGYTTPILAAIGGSNVKVLDLLVHQPGFDPTRRVHKGLTYFELAKERQGSEWQEEYDLLKSAHDEYKQSGGRRNNHNSPQKLRAKRADSRKSSEEPSSSPHEMRKIRRPQPAVQEEDGEGPKQEPKRRPSYQGTASRRPDEVRKPTPIASDQDANIRPKGKDQRPINRIRSTSPSQPPTKQRRRLMSGNDVKTGQELRKSKSSAIEEKERRRSGDSVNSHEAARPRKSSDASTMSAPTHKKASSESPRRVKDESGRKRQRTSTSPQASRSEVSEALKKKKRQRVDSHGNAIDQSRERPTRLGPAPPANMLPNTSLTSSPKPTATPASTAPVAFMGSATESLVNNSPVNDSSAESKSKTADTPLMEIGDQTMESAPSGKGDEAEAATIEEDTRLQQEEEERQRQEKAEQEQLARIEAEERQKVDAKKQAQLRKEREEAEREAQLAREKEEEAARQAQDEQRRQREELEAQAKKRKEDELQKRRAEQERQRKLEQDKRRLEAEQREIAIRLKAQEEEEAARRNALPNGLRRYLELTPDQARSQSEIKRWLPLRTITTRDLDANAQGSSAQERWIANVQVAPLLANQDLELSQYTAWSRRPATSAEHHSLWRQLRNPMAQAVPNAWVSVMDAYNLENETFPKFLNLKVFWIKLADFMDIVPRHPHLAGTNLRMQDFVLHFAWGKKRNSTTTDEASSSGSSDIKKEEVHSPSLPNGNSSTLANGHK